MTLTFDLELFLHSSCCYDEEDDDDEYPDRMNATPHGGKPGAPRGGLPSEEVRPDSGSSYYGSRETSFRGTPWDGGVTTRDVEPEVMDVSLVCVSGIVVAKSFRG